ncbi:pectin methylesterase, family CE8 [Zostera marina]|uniref:Pectinesterase n=1 Tax=Zostera marina TaxID=29655 RepID=A0A0K9PBU6_ZOSMR|nr:pectin methylesterase, family CE8 [Zostera marina]
MRCGLFWALALVLLLFIGSSATTITTPSSTLLKIISNTCQNTRFPSLCLRSISDFPGVSAIGTERDVVHVSINMTIRRVGKALYGVSTVANTNMDQLSRSAYDDCMELLDDTSYHLSRSLEVVSPTSTSASSEDDVHTWLSAAVTNQDTCMESLEQVPGGKIKNQMMAHVRELSELVTNCLTIFANTRKNKEFDGIPIQNKRRKLMEFPSWFGRKERRLLQSPASTMTPDFVVSQDGTGTHTTIKAAVKSAPKNSTQRIIIYIKAGRYEEEYVKLGRKKQNIMLMGEGKGQTIISAGRSVFDNFTTFHTATVAATGCGFIARDLTIENWAGPEKHQAVALRVGADHAVVYRCNVIGYQDSLYVHSLRQFYRECDIYGTVDFIFGNAAVVFQDCNIWARKPMAGQKNTITAQNRKDPNQNTGISIHGCRIYPAADLKPVVSEFPTYLGRPWKLYSRTVYMLSYISDHVHQDGWLPWNADFALDTLYYGEYMNDGPGAGLSNRVTWPGYKVITLPEEADKFTVAEFITGSSWLPSTGVSFLAGLNMGSLQP